MLIDPKTLKEELDKEACDFFLLDVRSPEEYAEGCIEGSVNIPLQDLPNHLSEIPKDRRILTICTIGARSAKAADFLNSQGWNAFNLEGGLINWNNCFGPNC